MSRVGFLQLMQRNTGWLYAAETLPKLAAFVIVPIWSARVAPEEYAHWILALTSTELVLGIGGLGVGTFLTKVLYRYHDERAERYFGMGGAVVLGATALGAAILMVGSPWLSQVLIGPGVRRDVYIWLGLYIVLAQFSNLVSQYLGAKVEYRQFFALVTARWIFNATLLLIFLLGCQQGFYSWIWAWLGTELLLFPVGAYHLRRVRWGWGRRRMWGFALRFSLPSLFSTFLGWGQDRMGRYVLSFSGLGAGVGLYGMAQGFANQCGGLMRPAKVVAQQILGHALEEDADSPQFLECFHLFACLALVVVFLMALFLQDVMRLVVSSAYHGASVALTPLLFGLYASELSSMYHLLMFRYFRVWFYPVASLLAFLGVAATTLLLVPWLGVLGAAAAQGVGGAVLLVFGHGYATSITKRQFRFWEKALFAIAALSLAMVAEWWTLTIPLKLALAMAALSAYALFHWRRRRLLFPLSCEAIGMASGNLQGAWARPRSISSGAGP